MDKFLDIWDITPMFLERIIVLHVDYCQLIFEIVSGFLNFCH